MTSAEEFNKFCFMIYSKNTEPDHSSMPTKQFMHCAQQFVATKIIKVVFIKHKSYSCIVLYVLLWFHGLSFCWAEWKSFSFSLSKYHFRQITQFFTQSTLINGQTLLFRPLLLSFVHFPSVMLVKLLAIFHVSTHRNIFRRRFLAFQRL